jgi:predicted small secreted protein
MPARLGLLGGTSGENSGLSSYPSARAGAQLEGEPTMRKNIRTKVSTAAGLLAVCLLAAACNTVAGAGKDTSALGHDVTHAADSAKP